MPVTTLIATNIGRMVHLDRASYTVIGVYKNGASLASSKNELIYLTSLIERGPFHLVAPGINQWLQHLIPGTRLNLKGQYLNITDLNVQISVQNAIQWPKYSSPTIIYWPFVKSAVRQTLFNLSAFEAPQNAVINLIDWDFTNLTINKGRNLDELTIESQFLVKRLSSLHHAFATRNLEQAIIGGASLLGLGSGLTPSGDDILSGILSVLFDIRNSENTWAGWIDRFSNEFVSRSQTATNVISAALISAAVQGEMNQNLAYIKSGLWKGNPPSNIELDDLKKVGHTSGVDGLVGILLAMLSFIPADVLVHSEYFNQEK